MRPTALTKLLPEAPVSGLLTAIEDGLYTLRMKTRFQQLEDQARKLKARLQIGAEQMKTVQTQEGAKEAEAIVGLMADLRTSDDEYAIRKLRRLLGPIRVASGNTRGAPSLRWEQAAGFKRQRGRAKTHVDSRDGVNGAEVTETAK